MFTAEAKILSPEEKKTVAAPRFEELFFPHSSLPNGVLASNSVMRESLWETVNAERLATVGALIFGHFGNKKQTCPEIAVCEDLGCRSLFNEYLRLKNLVNGEIPNNGSSGELLKKWIIEIVDDWSCCFLLKAQKALFNPCAEAFFEMEEHFLEMSKALYGRKDCKYWRKIKGYLEVYGKEMAGWLDVNIEFDIGEQAAKMLKRYGVMCL